MTALAPPMTATEYTELLLRLGPQGFAFGPGGRWEDALAALAAEMARVNDRTADAEAEANPRTADETIALWEAELGIVEPAAALEDRQIEAYARMMARGGNSASYFVGLAAAMGLTVTIARRWPWDCTKPPQYPLLATWIRFVWTVTGPTAATAAQRAAIQALFEARRPATDAIIYSWTA